MLQSGGKFRRKMSGRFGNFTRAGPAPRGEAKWSACPVGRHNPAPCLQTCAHFLELSPVCTGLYTGILGCAGRLPARNPGTLPTKRQKFWRFPQPVQEAVPRPVQKCRYASPLWGSEKKKDGPPQEFVCFPEENIWTNAERFDIREPYSHVKGAVCHDWNVRSDLYS